MMQIGSSLTRFIGATAFVAGCALAIPAVSLAQTPAAPANVTGTWNMSLIGDHVIPVALVLDQQGTAVTGTFILMGKDFAFTGDYVAGQLTLKGKGPAFGRPGGDHNAVVAAGGGQKTAAVAGPPPPGSNIPLADMTISGTTDGDGGLAGNIAVQLSDGTGMMKWTAERLKERKVPASQAAAPSEGVNLTGAWTMTIIEAQVVMDVKLEQSGTKVTGTATSEHLGTMTVAGSFVAGTLSFVSDGEAQGQKVRIEYTGKYRADGTFAGDATSPMGALTWTAARVKK